MRQSKPVGFFDPTGKQTAMPHDERAQAYQAIEQHIRELADLQRTLAVQAQAPFEQNLDALLKLLNGSRVFFGIPRLEEEEKR